jgi:hypothetical protein
MSSFNKSMFESIKEELNKSKAKSGLRDILRTPPGHTYTVRLIPNIQDPKKTFFHYYNFGWESYATGEYVQFISPSTWNERDPIAEGRLKCLKHGNAEDKAKAEKLGKDAAPAIQQIDKSITKEQATVTNSQKALDVMEAEGQFNTPQYTQAAARHAGVVDKANKTIASLNTKKQMLQKPVTVQKAGKPTNRKTFTVKEKGVEEKK